MAFQWKAKIHKSGSKVRIYDGDKFIREVTASSETFEPAEAKTFASELLTELEKKSAQMTDTSASPDVTTEKELHEISKDEVMQNATGDDLSTDVELQDDVLDETKLASLKKTIIKLQSKLINERKERVIERKARRGLAIAKQLVASGDLKNDFTTIRTKVAEIVNMESSEIDRLERKTAGEKEFETPTEALKEARRLKRIARVNRVAAEDAQQDGDEEMADQLDNKAEIAETKAASYEKLAEEMIEEDVKEEKQVEEVKEEKVEEEKQVEEIKEEVKEEKQVEEVKEEVKEEKVEEKQETTDDAEMDIMMMAAKKYHRIASKYRKAAEEAEAKGDELEADKQDELADIAEEKALDFEAKCSSQKVATEEVKEEVIEEKQDEEVKEEKVEEEKQDDEVIEEETEEKQDDEIAEEEPKTAKKKTPPVLKRANDGKMIDGFGFDKSASVEENTFANDPEVSKLESIWRKVSE